MHGTGLDSAVRCACVCTLVHAAEVCDPACSAVDSERLSRLELLERTGIAGLRPCSVASRVYEASSVAYLVAYSILYCSRAVKVSVRAYLLLLPSEGEGHPLGAMRAFPLKRQRKPLSSAPLRSCCCPYEGQHADPRAIGRRQTSECRRICGGGSGAAPTVQYSCTVQRIQYNCTVQLYSTTVYGI